MNYTDIVATWGNLLNYPDTSQANFQQILPQAISYAELKMLRDPDLDFLGVKDSSVVTLSVGDRDVTMPAGMIILEELNIITPAATDPDDGTRHQAQAVSLAFLNSLIPSVSTITGVPVFWAMHTDTEVRLGPTPDAAYKAEFYGVTRPATLSSGNPTTFISENLPDLMVSAGMIFLAGYQREFGAQADDPKMAMSWSALYESQKRGAAVESARQKSQASGWTAKPQAPVATPNRS